MTNKHGDGDADSGQRLARYNWEQSQQPTTAIREAVAAATGSEQSSLEPLDRYIDTSAVDSLLNGATTGTASLSFDYDGIRVDIDSSGLLEIRHSDGPESAAEFEAELSTLIQSAAAQGVSVDGAYEVQSDDRSCWDVHITRVERR